MKTKKDLKPFTECKIAKINLKGIKGGDGSKDAAYMTIKIEPER